MFKKGGTKKRKKKKKVEGSERGKWGFTVVIPPPAPINLHSSFGTPWVPAVANGN